MFNHSLTQVFYFLSKGCGIYPLIFRAKGALSIKTILIIYHPFWDWVPYRHLRKVDCIRYISWQKIHLEKLVASSRHKIKYTGLPALLACLPCQSACLVSVPALSAYLPCQLTCLVSVPALSAYLPCQHTCLVSLPALSACLSLRPAYQVSHPQVCLPCRLHALSAWLPCWPACLLSFEPATSPCYSKWIPVAITSTTWQDKIRQVVHSINQSIFNVMSMPS